MNEQEAIKELKRQIECWESGEDFEYKIEPLKAAISALEECAQLKRDLDRQIKHSEHLAKIQRSTKNILKKREAVLKQYSTIGTVEEFQADREKQKKLESERSAQISAKPLSKKEFLAGVKIAFSMLKTIQQYSEIGSVEECRAARKKQRARKVLTRGLGQRYCPVCGSSGADYMYCKDCGQKLG